MIKYRKGDKSAKKAKEGRKKGNRYEEGTDQRRGDLTISTADLDLTRALRLAIQ